MLELNNYDTIPMDWLIAEGYAALAYPNWIDRLWDDVKSSKVNTRTVFIKAIQKNIPF